MAYGTKTTKTFNVSSSSVGWYYDLVMSYQQDNDEGLTKVTIEYGQLRKVGATSDYNRGTVTVGVKLNGVEYLTSNITNNDAGQTLTKHVINKSAVYSCDDNGNTPSIAIQCKVTFSTDSVSAYNPKQNTYKSVGTLTIPVIDAGGTIRIVVGSVAKKGKVYIKRNNALKKGKSYIEESSSIKKTK